MQPRTGIAYQVRSTGTVLHFSYARVFLTPYNENLVLSSATGPGGLGNGSLGATGVQPLTPARRNQYNVGLEQQFGAKFNIQAEYFWKYTHGAYDFNTILNTPAELSHPVPRVENRWRDGSCDSQQFSRTERIRRVGTQPIPIVQPGDWRDQFRVVRTRRLPAPTTTKDSSKPRMFSINFRKQVCADFGWALRGGLTADLWW